MGTELMRSCAKEEEMDFQSIPPGFGPLASFTVKTVEDGDKMISCSGSSSTSKPLSVKLETELDNSDAAKTRSLRRRPWINYGRYDDSSGDESDPERIDKNISVKPCLPKGVIRGCAECSNCQKVTARWHPEDARRHDLEDAPVFYPNEEEFEDTLNYIARIRPTAEPYGICRIVPPPSWKPPCPLKETNMWQSSKFATRVQRVDKLQNRDSMKKMSRINSHMKRKRRKCMRMGLECGSGHGDISGLGGAETNEAESFGFEPGPEFTLNAFRAYADDFKSQYFSKNKTVTNTGAIGTTIQEQSEPSIEDIEGEYWRVVEKPSEEIEVLYGADLETGTFGSGFPKMSSQLISACDECYIKSGWNLNNFPRLAGSVLSYESGDISGVLVPWLYIGMCFSSFCWHVEDHHLYSMNYMHWGEPKLWYGISARYALKLEAAMRKHLPDLFEEQPDLLHKLVTQLSPSILKSEGIPVYRCVQNSGEFVLTFPRAYHSGFNCGFNCAEAVNVAPVDWLPHGQKAIELYCEQGRRTSISHDKLLLGAAREAVRAHWELNLLKKNTPDNLRWKDVCGKQGILAKALKTRVEMELTRRQYFCSTSQAVKMDSNFDATSERECSICLFDLHLSAAGCYCSPDKYSCLTHAKQLCSCAGGTKIFLFRYDIDELNILVEALEGKLSAIYRWARMDLGLALSSYISKTNMQVPRDDAKLSYIPGVIPKKNTSRSSETLLNQLQGKEDVTVIPNGLTGNSVGISSLRKEKPSEAVSAFEDAHSSSRIHKSLYGTDTAYCNFQLKKNGSVISASNLGSSAVCQFSEEDASYSENLTGADSKVKPPSSLEDGDIILLSDDEGEEANNPGEKPNKSVSDIARVTSFANQSEFPERLTGSDDNTSLCNYNKDLVLDTRTTNAAVMGEGDASFLPEGERNIHPSQPVCDKNEDQGQGKKAGPPSSCMGSGRSFRDSSIKTDNGHGSMVNSGNYLQHPQPYSSGRPNHEDKHETMKLSTNSNFVHNVRTITANPSCTQNNLDRYFRQKGPRIAKAVRRINCNVEPLEYGVVHSGKLWCNSQAIFLNGYRSRVKYISVVHPADMCYYVSEILDGGRIGPLFMVSLENFPDEVFIHVSAAKCWEMVRDKVNEQISRQHKLGRMKLPPLQPPGSLDGLEMFGFSSPAIVQAIEAMDRNRVCTEYWNSRPYSRFQIQVPEQSQSKDNGGNLQRMSEEREAPETHKLPAALDTSTILGGLLKKANPEELHLLNIILSSDNKPITDLSLVNRLLHEEIQKQPP